MGGHVGLDHADALGDADDPRTRAAHASLGDLRAGVGGHDCAGDGSGVVGAGDRTERGETSTDLFHRILTTDHAGRGDHHVARVAFELRGDTCGNLASIAHSFFSGRHVGVLRQHDHAARRAVRDMFAAHDDTRTGETALCEECAADRAWRPDNHYEVERVVFDAKVRRARNEAVGQQRHAD